MAIYLSGCDDKPWNHPHPNNNANANVFYTSFTERPKTLDPARAYTTDESVFTAQIYEPPLQYHYLKEPYTLIPLTAMQMPKPKIIKENGQVYSIYEITIKPGILYQPHPAFAKSNNLFIYHALTKKDLKRINDLDDFKNTGTRELTADDYVYQIKRLAHPKLQSPIFGLMSQYIYGLNDYKKTITKVYETKKNQHQDDFYFDLRKYPLKGVRVLGKYKYQITLKGQYPQFQYWLAMPFFAPIPWEADLFYSQPGMDDKNISFDWYPVGTGPYMLIENNPNRQMILAKNPNFHHEIYPETSDEKFKAYSGKKLPFIDKYVFSLEKESIPRWSKFLQGYYDRSGIASDNFDQVIKLDHKGKPYLTKDMREKNLSLQTGVSPGIFYLGFNMLDNVVGGNSESARKLRQAISVVFDYEEFISIFLNGRGVIAHGPLPPGIFGYEQGVKSINPYIHTWINGKAVRKPISYVKKLLAQAGYPNGRSAKTGKPLILSLDVASRGSPDEKSRFDWMRKQFAKLGIELQIRATSYNQFQEKMRNGNAQLFTWGWLADYPDAENFLFLLYGPNSKAKVNGENAANYVNKEYDALFEKVKHMPNGTDRQALINQMLEIVRKDAPWIFGFHPQNFVLSQQWVAETKLNEMANNTLKYVSLDAKARGALQDKWNKPIVWPLILIVLLLAAGLIPVMISFWRKEHKGK